MEKDFKIFGDKNFSDLSQEIYENSKLKKTQIELLVQEVHGYIQGIEDIAVVGPILKELLDVGVKNDDNLLKLATVFQRIMAKAGNNDDDISLSTEEVAVVNDKSLRMMPNGEVVTRRPPSGRDIIRRSGQFSRQNLLPNLPRASKRTRKKTKTDKNMSKALRLANERFRTAKGKLRKGASQAQIMKYAHKLLKSMK